MLNIDFALLGWATLETLYMVFVSSAISIVLGALLGVLLFATQQQRLWPHPVGHYFLDVLTNVFRSIPFIILLVAVVPITRLLVGTTIGTTASIVPLTIAAIPFVARIVENALAEVPAGLIEAGLAMGAKPKQIVQKILLPESLSTMIRGFTVTIITLISFSAMAGAIGGGGLGQMAINYGYQRFNMSVTWATVLVLIVMVQFIQWAGDALVKKVTHDA